MNAVWDFIIDQPEPERTILQALDSLLTENPAISSRIRYRVPFYYRKSWVCYLNPQKKGGIEICFLRANELSNTQNLLDFKDRKQVAGLTVRDVKELPVETLREVIQEALLLDEQVPYASKRIKK